MLGRLPEPFGGVSPLFFWAETGYIYNMKNEIALTASSLTAETLDWFEAARPRVAAYGLLNVFEDRADRLRYRAVEDALAAPKVTKKAKGVSKPVVKKMLKHDDYNKVLEDNELGVRKNE